MNDPARPDRRVESGELVVVGGNDRAEVLLDQVGVLAQGRVHVAEEDAHLFEILTVAVIDHLGVVNDDAFGDEVVRSVDLDVENGGDIGSVTEITGAKSTRLSGAGEPGELGQFGDVASERTG